MLKWQKKIPRQNSENDVAAWQPHFLLRDYEASRHRYGGNYTVYAGGTGDFKML